MYDSGQCRVHIYPSPTRDWLPSTLCAKTATITYECGLENILHHFPISPEVSRRQVVCASYPRKVMHQSPERTRVVDVTCASNPSPLQPCMYVIFTFQLPYSCLDMIIYSYNFINDFQLINMSSNVLLNFDLNNGSWFSNSSPWVATKWNLIHHFEFELLLNFWIVKLVGGVPHKGRQWLEQWQ